MSTDRAWSPPHGSVEDITEPGCWIAPSGDFYVDPATWQAWEADIAQRTARSVTCEQARCRRENANALRSLKVDTLVEHIHSLEAHLDWTQAELADARVQIAFVEDLLAAVLCEHSQAMVPR